VNLKSLRENFNIRGVFGERLFHSTPDADSVPSVQMTSLITDSMSALIAMDEFLRRFRASFSETEVEHLMSLPAKLSSSFLLGNFEFTKSQKIIVKAVDYSKLFHQAIYCMLPVLLC
jgi:hypothetical protein